MELRKFIKTTIREFLNESAESDIKANMEAKRIYNKIKNNINKIKFESTNIESDFVKDTKGNIYGIYGVKFNLSQLDKKYDLNIVFAHPIGKNIAHYDYKNNRILFFILSQSNKEDFSHNEYLTKLRFSSWVDENTFIHEFIHFLDGNRYGETYKSKTHLNDYEYYNSPEEYNSYSQEIIREIIKNKNELTGLSFDMFLRKSLKFGREGFINNLNDEYLKKLKNRLYKLYSELNSEVGKNKTKRMLG